MIKYVIYESDSPDGIMAGCITKDGWDSAPDLQLDHNDKPMKIVKEFEAETWEEAMQVFYDHCDYGKYKPMEEHETHNTPNPTAA
jgi:hypothetical protein